MCNKAGTLPTILSLKLKRYKNTFCIMTMCCQGWETKHGLLHAKCVLQPSELSLQPKSCVGFFHSCSVGSGHTFWWQKFNIWIQFPFLREVVRATWQCLGFISSGNWGTMQTRDESRLATGKKGALTLILSLQPLKSIYSSIIPFHGKHTSQRLVFEAMPKSL